MLVADVDPATDPAVLPRKSESGAPFFDDEGRLYAMLQRFSADNERTRKC